MMMYTQGTSELTVSFPTQMLRWLESLRVKDVPYGTYLMSRSSEATTFSSCFAVFLRQLFGDLVMLSPGERREWVVFLQECQDPETGLFVDPELSERPLPAGHDWTYVTWQLSTFCISALAALGAVPRYPLFFLEPFKREEEVLSWVEQRRWREPWLEGNNVMFLGILLIVDWEQTGDPRSRATVEALLDWHDRFQDPHTGFWGQGRSARYFDGLFGAFHQYLLYYYLARPLQYMPRIVDRTLLLQQRDGLWSPLLGGGGCEDMDAVDTLVNMHKRCGYRQADIEAALRRAYGTLLTLQSQDGGFLWTKWRRFGLGDWMQQAAALIRHGDLYYWYACNRQALVGQIRAQEPRVPIGWVKRGIPADESDIYGTWVRCLTIGLICQVLPDLPHAAIPWTFLSTPGLGWHRTG